MPLVQVYVPKGTLSQERRDQISRDLLDGTIEAEGAPDIPLIRSFTWVMWHELDDWWVAHDRVTAGAPPRYLVRVAVPGGAVDDAKRQAIVERVTQVLASADDEPGRFITEAVAFVAVDELPDGNWGTMGRVIRYPELVSLVKRAGDVAPTP